MSADIQDFDLRGGPDSRDEKHAAMVVASRARDVDDARELLDALGLVNVSMRPMDLGTTR